MAAETPGAVIVVLSPHAMIDVEAIRARWLTEAPLHETNLRIGWRHHQDIGHLLHEIERLTLIVQTIGYDDPRTHHITTAGKAVT